MALPKFARIPILHLRELLDCAQGQIMGEEEVDTLVKTFDKDCNSLFDKV